MTHEIKSSYWPGFCKLLTEQRAGATAKLEVMEPDGVKSDKAPNATFQSMVFTKTAGCSDTITMRLRNDREIVHEITEPIRLLLLPSEAPGNFDRLQIEAESGMTFMTLHPAIHTQMLEELKAG